jgi:hypothetical protein
VGAQRQKTRRMTVMTGHEEETGYGRRGVKTKLLGFILMVLGVLDSLLTLRGGIPAYEYLLLILLGACVFAIGAVRGGRRPFTEVGEG